MQWTKKLTLLTALLGAGNSLAQPQTFDPAQFELEKVVIYSRHGLRSPVVKDQNDLDKLTPYQWAKWNVASGYLTPKGTLLETYFGQYLNQWFTANGLLTENRCATGEGIKVYANSVQRTMATAQAFIAGGFAGCNVTLEHRSAIGEEEDPLFELQVNNNDPDFLTQAKQNVDMAVLGGAVKKSYAVISEVVDYPRSAQCLQEGICDIAAIPDQAKIKNGEKPKLAGAVSLGKKLATSLLLEYYSGIDERNIMNGNISAEQWVAINQAKNAYYQALYGKNAPLAVNVSLPLLRYLNEQMAGNNKISVIVGHDSNIATLLAALQVQPYDLPEQWENTPIGGKLMFEVWKNKQNEARQVRLQYVYQTTQQIRQLTPLSFDNPPRHYPLIMQACQADSQGFCQKTKFDEMLQKWLADNPQ